MRKEWKWRGEQTYMETEPVKPREIGLYCLPTLRKSGHARGRDGGDGELESQVGMDHRLPLAYDQAPHLGVGTGGPRLGSLDLARRGPLRRRGAQREHLLA